RPAHVDRIGTRCIWCVHQACLRAFVTKYRSQLPPSPHAARAGKRARVHLARVALPRTSLLPAHHLPIAAHRRISLARRLVTRSRNRGLAYGGGPASFAACPGTCL